MHNASRLWIFLQCAAACFSFVLGESAALKGKTRLGVYCSSIPVIDQCALWGEFGVRCQNLQRLERELGQICGLGFLFWFFF